VKLSTRLQTNAWKLPHVGMHYLPNVMTKRSKFLVHILWALELNFGAETNIYMVFPQSLHKVSGIGHLKSLQLRFASFTIYHL
jgi:hypothetical protein